MNVPPVIIVLLVSWVFRGRRFKTQEDCGKGGAWLTFGVDSSGEKTRKFSHKTETDWQSLEGKLQNPQTGTSISVICKTHLFQSISAELSVYFNLDLTYCLHVCVCWNQLDMVQLIFSSICCQIAPVWINNFPTLAYMGIICDESPV